VHARLASKAFAPLAIPVPAPPPAAAPAPAPPQPSTPSAPPAAKAPAAAADPIPRRQDGLPMSQAELKRKTAETANGDAAAKKKARKQEAPPAAGKPAPALPAIDPAAQLAARLSEAKGAAAAAAEQAFNPYGRINDARPERAAGHGKSHMRSGNRSMTFGGAKGSKPPVRR